jgi:Tfp pilus assembly protein FimT
VTMLAMTILAALAAPIYQRWYRHMRRPDSDERPAPSR